MAALARGIVRHHADDARFHGTRAFAELSLHLTVAVREAVGPDDSFRPSFLGHILVELLLDDVLIQQEPERLERYYLAMAEVDPQLVQTVVNRISVQPTRRLVEVLPLFCREWFLWDYAEDGKLMLRLNQVLRRVGLAPLPESVGDILPEARRRVASRAGELLSL